VKAPLKSIVQTLSRKLLPAKPHIAPTPLSRVFGIDRGQPIDRYYIAAFIAENQDCIRGVALEIAEPRYASGYRERLERLEILHVSPEAKGATIIGDLSKPEALPRQIADCFICTQTYQCIYDVAAAIQGSAQMLRPGGTLLATFAGISQISRYDMDRWGDFWRFTPASVKRLLEQHFPPAGTKIKTFGNVLSATAFLQGCSVEDMASPSSLDEHDPDYPVIITVRADKLLT
jgi:hypothetical protein